MRWLILLFCFLFALPAYADVAGTAKGDNASVNGTAATDANFLDNIYIDWLINTSSAPDDITAIFNFAETLAGNPALNAEECVFTKDDTGGGLLCEGSAADSAEGIIVFNPTTSDKTVTIQDATTTLVGRDTTDTLTNKTLAAANNVIDADTAVALAANGANCSAGNYPLGVDAAGAVESCTADDDVPEAADYSNLTGGTGIQNSPTGTIGFKFSDTLAGNPAFNAGEGIFSDDCTGGGFLFEGTVGANTNEYLLCSPLADPADTTNYIALGDSSGNALAGDSATSFFSTGTLEDARLSANVSLLGQSISFISPAEVVDECTGSQSIRRNSGDTAWECYTPGAGGTGDIEAVGSCATGSCAIEGGNDMFPFIYEGTANTEETTFQVTDPATSDKTITFPNLTGIVALSANKLDFFAATTSAEIATVVSDEVGSGKVVFNSLIKTLVTFRPQQAESPASNFATFDTRNNHPVLDFDATTNECTNFTFIMPQAYSGGGVTVYIHYAMTSATSGDVDWNAAFERIGDQQQDIDADSFAAAQSVIDTTVPATSGNVDVVSIAFTNGAQMDSCAAGEACRIQLCRGAAADTATGDAELVALEMRES